MEEEKAYPDFHNSPSRKKAVEYRDNLIKFLSELNGFTIDRYGMIVPCAVPKEYQKRSKNSLRLEKMLIAEIYHFSKLLESKESYEQSGKDLFIQNKKTLNDYE